MKKIILPLFGLICSCVNSMAQFSIDEGPIIEKSETGSVAKILGGDQNNFYVLRENGKGKGQKYFIEQYGMSEFNKGFSVQLPVAQKAQNIESYFTGERSIFFYCTQESKKTTSSLLYCSVDSKGIASPVVELAKINNKHPEKNLWVFPSFYFTINISPDKKFIAIVTKTYENKGKELKLTLNVFNSQTMTKEWEKDITEVGGKNYMIDNDGTVMYVSFASETNERNLIIVGKSDKTLNKIPINLKPNQIMEGVNIISANNVVIVGGFFKEIVGKINKAGTFCQTFDVTTKKNIKFNQEYLSDELTKSLFASKDDFNEKYIDIDDARIIGSSFYFLGKDVEKDFKTKERTTYSANTTFTQTPTYHGAVGSHNTAFTSKTTVTHSATYNTDKILVFKVNADGQTDWVKDISASSSVPTPTLPFLVSANISLRPEIVDFTLDDKLLLIYGDAKFVGWHLSATNVAYSLFDQKGTVASGIFFKDNDKCFLYNGMGIYGYFNVYFQYGKNVIVYFNQKDNQHFGRIVFK